MSDLKEKAAFIWNAEDFMRYDKECRVCLFT